jgi:hypothetical protein
MEGDMDTGDDSLSIDDIGEIDEEDRLRESSKEYSVTPSGSWPPPPPLKENKVVHQLDDVTKESEEKATQIFDMLEAISNEGMVIEEKLPVIMDILNSNISILEKLSTKFPNIELFKEQIEKNSVAIEDLTTMQDGVSSIGMNCMSAMDTMQYQDIHRQKIERVINIMRALSNYMNKLFEGKIDDDKRVSSAKHIHGDDSADKSIVDEDDIEALIASFGKK